MVEIGQSLSNQQDAVSSQSGIYRAAFPAFRVFIYGQEVSGDVIDVRVNQSGGSMDRSPGTCSITLYNPQDKYIMDHSDIVALSNGRGQLLRYLEENVVSSRLDAYRKDAVGWSGEDASDVREFFELLSSEGRFEELSADIAEFYEELKAQSGWHQQYWEEGKTPDGIKYNVVESKAPQLTLYGSNEKWHQEMFGESSASFDEAFKYIYPFTEGDCIFHPNDPIRIAFRDPFNPATWYWMFSGFVDGFTEDMGVNQESIITIVGTDVSKILRYSFLQLNTDAVLDKSISSIFPNDPVFSQLSATVKWVAYQELFAHFTVFEILEMLFFGKDSVEGALTELTQRAVQKIGLNEAELKVFLEKAHRGLTEPEIDAMSKEEKKEKIKDYLIGTKASRFKGSVFPPVHTPGGVTFSRKNSKYGTFAYFIGSSAKPKPGDDAYDRLLGTVIPPDDLRQLNEVLHHRVSLNDLNTMKAGVHDLRGTDKPEALSSIVASPAGLADVVTTIGADFESYPVGGGRVFYIAPVTLSLGLSSGVMNEMVGGSNGGLHSEFKDRLTYLYDVAEQIQFCCYATPKGDFVFEMPFYDYNPWHFDAESAHTTNQSLGDSADELRKQYERMRANVADWASGASRYTEAEIYKMMQLSSDLQLVEEGFDLKGAFDQEKFPYSDYFTISKHETSGFSNSLSDRGLKTFARSAPHNIARFGVEVNDINTRNYQWAIAPGLAPTLGPRPVADKDPWTEVTTEASAKFFASVELRKANAEARNVGLQIVPHFGLMVNRPLYWRQRNYVANIVSCQHSISVNSSCDTTVNLNLARGWTGQYQKGSKKQEIFEHFGGETPFNYARLLAENEHE